MSVYYHDDHVTLYHGDCHSDTGYMQLRSADVLVTDPPYGYSYASNRKAERDQVIHGDQDTRSRDAVLKAWGDKPAIVFGHWKNHRPYGIRTILVWDKGESTGMGDLTLPWKGNWEEIYILGQGFTGHRGGSVLRYTVPNAVAHGRNHQNEKPVGLMRDLIQKCPPGVIIDPFAGSGTTLRAAKDLGRRAVGFEIEERYCRIAAERLGQEALAL